MKGTSTLKLIDAQGKLLKIYAEIKAITHLLKDTNFNPAISTHLEGIVDKTSDIGDIITVIVSSEIES